MSKRKVHISEDAQLYKFKRTEQLGDSIVRLVIVEHVSSRRIPGEYTEMDKHRMRQAAIQYLERNSTIGKVAKNMGMKLHRDDHLARGFKRYANKFEHHVAEIYQKAGFKIAKQFVIEKLIPELKHCRSWKPNDKP